MFQADPFVETILFKTHHSSVRSLLPGPPFAEKMKAQRDGFSGWWTLSAHGCPLWALQRLALTQGEARGLTRASILCLIWLPRAPTFRGPTPAPTSGPLHSPPSLCLAGSSPATAGSSSLA